MKKSDNCHNPKGGQYWLNNFIIKTRRLNDKGNDAQYNYKKDYALYC